MISTMTSSSELSGVRIGSEEIQRRWELVFRKNELSAPVRVSSEESVKLTVLISIHGRLSQNKEMPVTLNSVCECRSKQWEGLSQMTLSEKDEGLAPRA